MMELHSQGALAQPNNMRIKEIHQDESAQEMADQYKKALVGIGKIRDNKADREIYGKFNMQQEATAVAQQPRQVPYFPQKQLKKWIEECEEQDIIEKFQMVKQSQSCSPLVVQPKPMYKDTLREDLESHMIRASVDLRVPNKYMKRNRISPAPVVEDFTYKFHDCKIFSKLDMRWGPEQDHAFNEIKQAITSEDTIVFFDPRRPIIVKAEASFHEGLSAGLFQDTEKGVQPVHFISRTMKDHEKRYSQTEMDALAIKWAKKRFSLYLLGAPKFKIITAHRPLIPMFNKAIASLPPRFEKWVMDLQDVDFELLYEPGRDEKDPYDYLSRHPLPATGSDDTEIVLKRIIEEPAVVLDHIKKETKECKQMTKLQERIQKGDWNAYKKDPDIEPCFMIREELFRAERLDKIVIPSSLQRKVIKAAHSMGHLGITKTEQLLRNKYILAFKDEPASGRDLRAMLRMPGDNKESPTGASKANDDT